MTTALGEMTTSADGSTQRLDYETFDNPAAYPLTTISYAMAPTCGLPAGTADAVAAFLDYAASDAANTVGSQPGQLAPGFLPMPDAMRAQTNAVASSVAGQRACPTGSSTPPPTTSTPRSNVSDGHHGTGNSAPGGVGDPGGVGGPGGIGGPGSTGAGGASSTRSPGASPAASATPVALHIPSDTGGAPAFFLPVVLCVGAGLLLAGPALVVADRRGFRRPSRVRRR